MKWLNEVKEGFEFHNGVASLDEIYQYVKKNYESEYKDDSIWEAQKFKIK